MCSFAWALPGLCLRLLSLRCTAGALVILLGCMQLTRVGSSNGRVLL
jgi:hypothetical protein